MKSSDRLLTDARVATMRGDPSNPYGAIEYGALAIRDGEISKAGSISGPGVLLGPAHCSGPLLQNGSIAGPRLGATVNKKRS